MSQTDVSLYNCAQPRWSPLGSVALQMQRPSASNIFGAEESLIRPHPPARHFMAWAPKAVVSDP